MKIIKPAGLILFIAGFIIFNVVFFYNQYTLTPQQVETQITDDVKADIFFENSDSLLNTLYSSNFAFVADLNDVFERSNQQALARFNFTSSELESIIASYKTFPSEFKIESIAEQLEGSDTSFKIALFESYGGWMEGRSYASSDELKNHLNNVTDNIEKYGIISQRGFDRYEIKALKYSLSKAANHGAVRSAPWLYLLLTFGLCIIGALMYILPNFKTLPGIKNNGIFFSPLKTVKWLGIITGSYLILFYIVLYYYPQYMTGWILMVDPISIGIKGSEASPFFLYGLLYTICILVMGIRMISKYRHSKYQMARTASVMFFQTAFAFLIPEILLRLNQPYFDFKNIWPLDYDFFFDNELNTLLQSGGIGVFMLVWGIVLAAIAVPVLVYFFGKRWYCSWVCGCGGLAETLGDPFRQLSDKSVKAWKVERWMIHSVLIFAIVMTGSVLYTYFTGNSEVFGISSYALRETYGAWIGAGFAGVIGTGFYPLMGNRVWCRFGCPLAAYLGLIQRFKSRFRITTNGGQCISCGNCSTHCEMGIDVRWYAQRGQNIVRSSCVGCGVCSSVCPRGVLNLENKDEEGRFGSPIAITDEGFKLQN